MFPHRLLSLALALVCIFTLIPAGSAAEVDCDSVYCFSPEDFGEDLTGICITGLPETSGALLLDNRVLQPGDILTADQISRMSFHPLQTEEDSSAQVDMNLVMNETNTEKLNAIKDLPYFGDRKIEVISYICKASSGKNVD